MERSRRTQTKKQQRSSTLDALRAARSGADARTDQWSVPEEADVYEKVNEDQYRKIVGDRRQKEDFVVDDDGLGYFDDGEEHLGEEALDATGPKKAKILEKLHSDKALKRAKKLNELSADTGDEGSNQMWRYMSGGPGTKAAAPTTKKKPRASGAPPSTTTNSATMSSLESLIDSVGMDTGSLGEGQRTPAVSRAGQKMSHSALAAAQLPASGGRNSLLEPRRFWDSSGPAATSDEAPSAAAENDAFFCMSEDAAPMMRVAPLEDEEAPTQQQQPPQEAPAAKRAKSSRFSKAKVGEAATTEAARKVLEEKEEEEEEEEEKKPASPPEKEEEKAPAPTTAPLKEEVVIPASWRAPDVALDEPTAATLVGATVVAGKVELTEASWKRTLVEEDGSSTKEYLSMYWLDVHEQNGRMYVIGKVEVQDAAPGTFVSCCVVVTSVERSFFVLPREIRSEDGTVARCDMGSVYKEVKGALIPACIPPDAQGDILKCRPVKRSYAFGDEGVPRDGATEYLKVKYAAKFAAPDAEMCRDGGRTFERILGAGASPLELFVLKRRLHGPCWLRIEAPKAAAGSRISWCPLEFIIDDAKALAVAGDECAGWAAPPVVTTAIDLVTAVNPQTQQHEIIAVAALTHRAVSVDAATVEGPCGPVFMPQRESRARHRRWTCIAVRPLSPDMVAASENAASAKRLPRELQAELKACGCLGMTQVLPNEKALLNCLLARLQADDPDVLVGHNILGFSLDILLNRTLDLKLGTASWSKLGRLRRTKPPHNWKGKNGRQTFHASATSGRLVADTYAFAREHISKVSTYSLAHLADLKLGVPGRKAIEPHQVPPMFASSAGIAAVLRHAAEGARLVERLMLKLQVLPLSKQLTAISGNLLASTLKGNRAGRIEFLLLHEFHRLKYIAPEKPRGDATKDTTKKRARTTGRQKAGYSGGLVLEPKKGFYDSHVLLLDFNSLYPSIIQEYDVCFTTIPEWPKFQHPAQDASAPGACSSLKKKKRRTEDGDDGKEEDVEEEEEEEETAAEGEDQLPPLPVATGAAPKGILPRVLKSLIARRREVKQLLKAERSGPMRETYDIRQLALKLTANSMYGCLGFQHSRFYAKPLAALVTSLGRETLQATAELVPREFDLEVIYGDTDSIMINTRLDDLKAVKEIGQKVKRAVNKRYKLLELEVDGIFKRMVLYKKKKYAAVVVEEQADGTVALTTETKGIDHVRRDWCELSKRTGRYVLDRLLSGENSEAVVADIHARLGAVAAAMRKGEVPLLDFVITKGLNKPVEKYPDAKSQPHLKVAKAMIKQGRPVNVGDHIPYVICVHDKGDPKQLPSDRAFHPDEAQVRATVDAAGAPIVGDPATVPPRTPTEDEDVMESKQGKGGPGGAENVHLVAPVTPETPPPAERGTSTSLAVVDVEWYIAQQVLPPIERLCEPIALTSRATLAAKLGLDARKYAQTARALADAVDDATTFTPSAALRDSERFAGCTSLAIACLACGSEDPLVLHPKHDKDAPPPPADEKTSSSKAPLDCRACGAALLGSPSAGTCFARLSNGLSAALRARLLEYYEGWVVCDDPHCGARTRQLSVGGDGCRVHNCRGRLAAECNEKATHTQLKYLEALFDADRARATPGSDDREILQLLQNQVQTLLAQSAYNFIHPSIFSVFQKKTNKPVATAS